MIKKKYCKCKEGLILANLETGKGECPLCNLPKKLSPRLKRMSKIYQDKTPKEKSEEKMKRLIEQYSKEFCREIELNIINQKWTPEEVSFFLENLSWKLHKELIEEKENARRNQRKNL